MIVLRRKGARANLKRAVFCRAIAAIIIWLWMAYGCTQTPVIKGVQTYCVPNAIQAAWTWRAVKGDDVRIAVTKFSPLIDHAQAEAKINGVWVPLSEFWAGEYVEIRTWKPHLDVRPYRYLTLKEWINEQLLVIQ